MFILGNNFARFVTPVGVEHPHFLLKGVVVRFLLPLVKIAMFDKRVKRRCELLDLLARQIVFRIYFPVLRWGFFFLGSPSRSAVPTDLFVFNSFSISP